MDHYGHDGGCRNFYNNLISEFTTSVCTATLSTFLLTHALKKSTRLPSQLSSAKFLLWQQKLQSNPNQKIFCGIVAVKQL